MRMPKVTIDHTLRSRFIARSEELARVGKNVSRQAREMGLEQPYLWKVLNSDPGKSASIKETSHDRLQILQTYYSTSALDFPEQTAPVLSEIVESHRRRSEELERRTRFVASQIAGKDLTLADPSEFRATFQLLDLSQTWDHFVPVLGDTRAAMSGAEIARLMPTLHLVAECLTSNQEALDDCRDLAEQGFQAAWLADLGARFVLDDPLHAPHGRRLGDFAVLHGGRFVDRVKIARLDALKIVDRRRRRSTKLLERYKELAEPYRSGKVRSHLDWTVPRNIVNLSAQVSRSEIEFDDDCDLAFRLIGPDRDAAQYTHFLESVALAYADMWHHGRSSNRKYKREAQRWAGQVIELPYGSPGRNHLGFEARNRRLVTLMFEKGFEEFVPVRKGLPGRQAVALAAQDDILFAEAVGQTRIAGQLRRSVAKLMN
jgi:hypothetical protein